MKAPEPTHTVALLVTNPSRSEVLLVRKANHFGPLEYGLVGLPPGKPTDCYVNLKAMLAQCVDNDELRDMLGSRTDETPLLVLSTNPTKRAALGTPSLFDVHQAVAADWKEWDTWCSLALRGGFTEDALWLTRSALARFVESSQAGHTCYEHRRPDQVSSKAIESLLEAGKAIDSAANHFAGPRDRVSMTGKTIVVHAVDEEQQAKLVKRARGILEWLPKGLDLIVKAPDRSLP